MSDVLLVALSLLLAVSGAALIVRWLLRRETFCSHCGARMKWHDQPAGFDPDTGKPRTWRTGGCSADGDGWEHDVDLDGRYVS